MQIVAVTSDRAAPTRALLRTLNVSLFGIHSPRLHARLVDDAIRRRVDGRVAIDGREVLGVVLAAPAWYWWWLPLRDWRIALAIAAARWSRRRETPDSEQTPPRTSTPSVVAPVTISEARPEFDWRHPGSAWRIIIVGTSPAARGRGVAAALYRQLMSERSLVARIARDNTASLRLHASTGWSLHRDGGVVLAVHDKVGRLNDAPVPVAEPREAGR